MSLALTDEHRALADVVASFLADQKAPALSRAVLDHSKGDDADFTPLTRYGQLPLWNPWELCGVPFLAGGQTATLNPARYFGITPTAGSVAPGRRADLVLLEANPLADIAAVRRIRAVIANGRMLDRRALDETLAQARAAAAR